MSILAAAEGGGSLLDPHLGTVLWTLISFGTVVVILWKSAWPKILDTIEKRSDTIRSDIEGAEKARQEAEERLKAYEAKLESARADAAKILEEGKSDAHNLKETILAEAKQEAEAIVARARREIGLAEAKALEALRERTAELVIEVAARVLRQILKPEDHERLIGEVVDEVEREKDLAAVGGRN